MNTRRQIQLLQVICTFVVLATCVGIFATGAWAFNTQTFRTPTETLEMGTFSVCVDDKVPDENGTYHLVAGESSVKLQAEGNMPSLVLTSWTPEGEEPQQYIVCLDPTCEEDSYVEIPVSTYKSMTLILTPVQEGPENVVELPEQIVVAAPPVPVEEANEATSEQTSEEETEETENTGSVNTGSVNTGSETTTTTSTDESTSEVVEPQEPATVEENTVEENTVEENTVESSEDNEVVTDEVATESEVESEGETSSQMPKEESEEPLITESGTTPGEPLA